MSLCPFLDQRTFMTACGQTVGEYSAAQTKMYADLVGEEFNETISALYSLDLENPELEPVADVADGLIDLIYVATGMLHSMGIDPNRAWNEVQRANMQKIAPETGKVRRRDDGKILKPEGWVGPDMVSVVRESWGLK